MADKDDTSKAPAGRNQTLSDVLAEPRPTPKPDERSYKARRNRLDRAIEAQRAHLLQAHGVLTCLYEVLLYAEGEDAIAYAQAAHVAASLVSESAEALDSTRIGPLMDALPFGSGGLKVEEPQVLYMR